MDPVDAAIGQAQQTIEMRRIGPIMLGDSGRPFFIEVPTDLTEDELLSVIAWTAAPAGLRTVLRPRATRPRLLIPTGAPGLS